MESQSLNIPEKMIHHTKKKIILQLLLFTVCILLAMYITLAIYFINHFYFGTVINDINVSGQHFKDVNTLMALELNHYQLQIIERNGKLEAVYAKEIDLAYQSGGDFKIFKNQQSPFLWFSALFNTESNEFVNDIIYNDGLLQEQIDQLDCFNPAYIIAPKNPTFEYTDNVYKIIPEVNGNKLDKTLFTQYVSEAILKKQPNINLESLGCYINPRYHLKSKKIIATNQLLNKYISTKITYAFGKDLEVLDGSIISNWLAIDNNYIIHLNEECVNNYIETLAEEYNTIGKKRRFVTSLGKEIIVGGGDYGVKIDTATERQYLFETINSGETITREPTYVASAMSWGKNDIGDTYVEISLTNQHLWFYKNGELISEGPIVTGNVRANHTTPPGIFKLKYKCKNVVLRGPDYAAPVTFWMPFNGGIGIHDASWRSSFGGTIYENSGSHGCINCPYHLAKDIYNNIQEGTPIICYN